MLNTTIKNAVPMIETLIQTKLVPLVKGSPGVGKSDILWGIATKHRLKEIDLRLAQCDPTDLLGFPSIKGEKASYTPMDTFPLEGDPIPLHADGLPYEGWLLFLDELTSASTAVQAAAYKIILDRKVGNHKLHPKVVIVAAGNLMTDGAIVEEMSSALQSRMVEIQLVVDAKEWLEWALNKGVDTSIMDFVSYMPDKLYTLDPENIDGGYACPRTWEFADRIIKMTEKKGTQALCLPLLAGTLGEAVAREYSAFSELYRDLPTMDEILANPKTAKLPNGPGAVYAMIGNLSSNMIDKNVEPILEFIERLPADFRIVAVKEGFRRQKNLMAHPVIQKWIAANSDAFFH